MSPKLLYFEIALETIAAGSIPIASTNRMIFAEAYSGPSTLRIAPGATINAATIGAVRLNPNLRLPDDKSALDLDEAGMTVNDRLEATPAPTTLIIKAI
jgi:hypothetical protein